MKRTIKNGGSNFFIKFYQKYGTKRGKSKYFKHTKGGKLQTHIYVKVKIEPKALAIEMIYIAQIYFTINNFQTKRK